VAEEEDEDDAEENHGHTEIFGGNRLMFRGPETDTFHIPALTEGGELGGVFSVKNLITWTVFTFCFLHGFKICPIS
jgi:hypothetical protein